MGDDTDPFPKLRSTHKVSGSKVKNLNQNVANIKLSSEPSGDHSKVNSWQSQSISGGSAPRPGYPQNYGSNAWGHPNVIHKLAKWGSGESGVANSSSSSLNYPTSNGKVALNEGKLPAQSTLFSTAEKGSYSSVPVDARLDSKSGKCEDKITTEPHYAVDSENNDDEIVDSESDIVFDSDDDLSLDDTDSDTAEKSHEGRKKSKWFGSFFDVYDRLTNTTTTDQAFSH